MFHCLFHPMAYFWQQFLINNIFEQVREVFAVLGYTLCVTGKTIGIFNETIHRCLTLGSSNRACLFSLRIFSFMKCDFRREFDAKNLNRLLWNHFRKIYINDTSLSVSSLPFFPASPHLLSLPTPILFLIFHRSFTSSPSPKTHGAALTRKGFWKMRITDLQLTDLSVDLVVFS